MTESESVALPFGDTPTTGVIIRHENHFVNTFFEKNIKNRQIWRIHVCLFDFVYIIVLIKDKWI